MTIQSKQASDTLQINNIDQLDTKIDQKENTTTNAFTTTKQYDAAVDPQVKPTRQYTPRRSYDNAYKARILASLDACPNASERAALLRREGLYYARICAWRNAQSKGNLTKKHDKN